MTCPGSWNMPLAEPRCGQEGSGPGVPALPTRVSCCLGQIKERSISDKETSSGLTDPERSEVLSTVTQQGMVRGQNRTGALQRIKM